jgi:lipoprotein NlpD
MKEPRPAALFLGMLFAAALFSGCETLRIFAEEPRGVYHTVQQGQTLYRISRVYAINLETLKRVNNIHDPTQVKIGQRLWIPNARRVLPVSGNESATPPSRQAARGAEIPVGKPVPRGYLAWPVKGTLSSGFGIRNGKHHDGIDVAADPGAKIAAAADGKVVFSGWGPRGYGLMVIIKHPNHLMTVYAHNARNLVGVNATVEKGQSIAQVGSTGRATGPHLHFEVRNDTHPVDPLLYLP